MIRNESCEGNYICKSSRCLFRNFVFLHAKKLNIKAYVKNNPDGTVEAVFEGDEDNINKMIELCKQGH